MSGRVIVVGSINIDLVARVPQLPHPGETVTGESYERHNGGKGGNQAVAAARLRRPTLMIGALGDDTFEIEARRALQSERVDVSMVASLPGQSTGVALILVDETGENEIAVVPGANGAIEAGYVHDCLARLGPLHGDALLACNEVPLHVVREALTCGRAAGATTILNPAPATGIDRSIFGLADIITPNRTELAILLEAEAAGTAGGLEATGADTPSGAAEAAGVAATGAATAGGVATAARARSLLEAGPEGPGVRKAVIVTLGAEGVVVLERAGCGLDGAPARPDGPARAEGPGGEAAPAVETPADRAAETTPAGPSVPETPSAVEPPAAQTPVAAAPAGEIRVWELPADRVATVDSTGAGDAFCGALAAALAEGRPLAEAVRRAVAGSALATTHSGAREGMPTAAELEAFLASKDAS